MGTASSERSESVSKLRNSDAADSRVLRQGSSRARVRYARKPCTFLGYARGAFDSRRSARFDLGWRRNRAQVYERGKTPRGGSEARTRDKSAGRKVFAG